MVVSKSYFEKENELMEQVTKKYQKELSQVIAELEKLPAGFLRKRRSFYYQVVKRKEVGITKKPDLIK